MPGVERLVEFRSGKLLLRGMLHLPDSRARAPGVLFLHGFTGNRVESHFVFVKTARELARRGIASLRFDFAGSGESEGLFEDMSVATELADAREALEFLASQDSVDRSRLGVLGLSMGGCVAAMLLADERLRAGVLWSAVADIASCGERIVGEGREAELRRRGFIVHGAHRLGRRFVEDAMRADPLSSIARSRADILIVHSTADPVVPVEHARMYERAARSRAQGTTELALIRGAGHTFESLPHEEEAIRLSVGFLAKTLSSAGAARRGRPSRR